MSKSETKKEKKTKNDCVKGDEDNIFYYKLDEKSEYHRHMGKNVFTGYWRRKVINPEDKKVLGIYDMTLKGNIPNGEVKGYLEYDGKEVLVFQGSFELGKPIGIHHKYLYDEEKKESVWISKDHFENYKLIKVETNVNGIYESGTPEHYYEKYGKEEDNSEEKETTNKSKSKPKSKNDDDKKLSKTELKLKCDELKIKYENKYPTKKDIKLKCDELKIKCTSKNTVNELLKLIEKNKNE